jgi:hypothetical protein
MYRPHLLRLLSSVTTLWEESGENLPVFCYLIAWGALAILRSRMPVSIPCSARLNTDCSNPSSTFSALCITQKDSDN